MPRPLTHSFSLAAVSPPRFFSCTIFRINALKAIGDFVKRPRRAERMMLAARGFRLFGVASHLFGEASKLSSLLYLVHPKRTHALRGSSGAYPTRRCGVKAALQLDSFFSQIQLNKCDAFGLIA
ncbi:MAG TPA: hypothetical protein VG328_10250 [Stellaceae bacterium]|nr:hypothetical protein [Stellaceae bacterium]